MSGSFGAGQYTETPSGSLRAEAVALRRGGRKVLQNIQLYLHPGQLTILTGPNGAGKSSLLGVLAGLIQPEQGSVSLDGMALREWPAEQLARRRALLGQRSQMEFEFSAEQVVMLGRSPYRRHEEQLRNWQIVEQAMRAAQAEAFVGRPYPQLSGGEQKRVQLARVLAQVWGAPHGAAWIMLDEPEAALDMAHQHALMRRLQALAGQGYGVIAAIHDLSLAARYADQVVLLQQGRQMAVGAPEDVLTAERVSEIYGVATRRLETLEGWLLWVG
ncbi:heme ABC transporter ATP-binding protein [Frateuria aurantia]